MKQELKNPHDPRFSWRTSITIIYITKISFFIFFLSLAQYTLQSVFIYDDARYICVL